MQLRFTSFVVINLRRVGGGVNPLLFGGEDAVLQVV
jgi:hypothetical protein